MIRKIITINDEKCVGCGLCANACHEGAIAIINGKAKLIRDDYCDGLGNCLPVCPTNAISFEEREADAYNKEVAPKRLKNKEASFGSCPSSASKSIENKSENSEHIPKIKSEIRNWPLQIQLAPINSPYFENANLLVAADCTAFAYGNFHNQFMKNKITLIGCPKLDSMEYTEKLTEIIKNNNIKSLTILRMEVPCCFGIEKAATSALQSSGKFIPWQVYTISVDGRILEN